ncbi:MAG: class II fructose-bisphosphate aldolase [Blautia sp.]|nr:class II fructose-bisphosphate aldolase [Blautia sp.]
MALVTLKEILANTRKEQYAVGAFNFSCPEDAEGIVMAGVEKKAPVILQVSMNALKYNGLKALVGYIKGMAESVEIPVCLHLDHATDYDLIRECVREGFTSVMVDASKKPYEENIADSRAIVEYAHSYGVSVEAELGMLGGREENVVVADASAAMTNPEDVPRFVQETGIDALAVAIGTAHGFYKADPKLDFIRLEKILQLTDCPLVLHGGTGVPEEDFRRCVQMGMSKINYGTAIKSVFVGAVAAVTPDEIQKVPGKQDPRNLLKPAKIAVAKHVGEKIDIYGSTGKAW